jgi:DNA polymerase
MEKPDTTTMEQLAERIAACTLCPLSLSRTRTVPGEGPVPSDLVFIGEAPGKTEDETGRPFVGRAGKILTGLLARCGLLREDVFITSIVKCRPPGNRAPKRGEIAACMPYLEEQIALLSPRILVPMGRFATVTVFGMYGLPFSSFKEVRGQKHVVRDHRSGREMVIVPVYHPAVITHNPPARQDLESDFLHLAELIGSSPRSRK